MPPVCVARPSCLVRAWWRWYLLYYCMYPILTLSTENHPPSPSPSSVIHHPAPSPIIPIYPPSAYGTPQPSTQPWHPPSKTAEEPPRPADHHRPTVRRVQYILTLYSTQGTLRRVRSRFSRLKGGPARWGAGGAEALADIARGGGADWDLAAWRLGGRCGRGWVGVGGEGGLRLNGCVCVCVCEVGRKGEEGGGRMMGGREGARVW